MNAERAPRFWPDAWLAWRNRVYASPGFQRWAVRVPLFRTVADRRARALFDLCAGFVYSQVLYACVQLQLFPLLKRGPARVEELAQALSLQPAAAERLLAVAAALELAEHLSDGRYALGIRGADLLGNPAVSVMVEHHALVYRDLAEPVALLRGEAAGTELSAFWCYARDADSHGYSELMRTSLGLVAEDIFEAYPFARHRCVLDVAGGEGGFVQALAVREPALSLMLFDLPAVAARARTRLAQAGLTARVRVHAGDMLRGTLPIGADLVTLVRVVHDHDDREALQLLGSVRRALAPGGTLLVAEPMAGVRGAEPAGDAYFGMYLLAMGRGRPRTEGALRALLERAGFARIRAQPTSHPMLVGVLAAQA